MTRTPCCHALRPFTGRRYRALPSRWLREDAVKPAPAAATEPVRKWVVYLLPHSHVDIGYTHIQPEVERVHWRNIDQALELCRKTADYPPGARFKWNAEVLWAGRQLSAAGPAGEAATTGRRHPRRASGTGRPVRQRVDRPVPAGGIAAADAMRHGDRPALRGEGRLGNDQRRAGLHLGHGARHGPGRSEVLSPSGTNYRHRIGRTMITWEDKPFYWLAPDGKQKVLCWIPFKGYALGHDADSSWTSNCRNASRNWSGRGIPTTSCNCGGASAATTARPTPSLPDW